MCVDVGVEEVSMLCKVKLNVVEYNKMEGVLTVVYLHLLPRLLSPGNSYCCNVSPSLAPAAFTRQMILLVILDNTKLQFSIKWPLKKEGNAFYFFTVLTDKWYLLRM